MRRYCYETTTDLPPELLFQTLADVASWPAWDDEIEAVEIDGPAVAGSDFILKPHGRDAVRLRVETMVSPYRFTDIAYLPLARMHTEHSFIPTPDGTLVRSTVVFTGLLAAFWDRPLARDYAEGAARQTRRFLSYARGFMQKPVVAAETHAPKQQPLPNYVFC